MTFATPLDQRVREEGEEMSGSILVTGASMVLPTGIAVGDLRITDGVISEISTDGNLIPNDGEHVYDAAGLHLLPGIIDPQVHFRDPGQPEKEDLFTGSRAAASGGVTSFLDMPNNVPSQTTLQSMYDKLETAANKCVTNYGFFIGATESNVEELKRQLGSGHLLQFLEFVESKSSWVLQQVIYWLTNLMH